MPGVCVPMVMVAADMLSHGFEWALMHSLPANQPCHRYPLAPACCDMAWTRDEHAVVR
jgi:hypothetical protein